MLFKVLIVEDEMWVRLGLKNSIDWKKFGMTVIGAAANGVEALECYRKEKPDLIITDLRMPEMGGLELIAAVREQDDETKFIILTCMEEFELMRAAIQMGVSDYILKLTMKPEEIENVLERIRKEWRKSKSAVDKHAIENRDILKERLIKDYLFRNRYTPEEFFMHAESYGLQLKSSRLHMVLMEIPHFYILQERFQDQRGDIIRMSLLNVLEEILCDYGKAECCAIQDDLYLILLDFQDKRSQKDTYELTMMILSHIRRALRTYFNVKAFFAVSGVMSDIRSWKQQYKACMDLLRGSALESEKDIHFADTDSFEGLGSRAIGKFDVVIAAARELGTDTSAALAKQVEDMIERPASSREELRSRFILWLYMPLQEIRMLKEAINQLVLNTIAKIQRSDTLDEMIRVFECYLRELQEHPQKENQLHPKVKEALTYIEKYYMNQISLQTVSSHVGVSPNYLTSLLRKELDVSFIQYVLEYRIERAKEMLLATKDKSYLVSERVGFVDHSHFSRTFKKMSGMSPREFRKAYLGDREEGEAGDFA